MRLSHGVVKGAAVSSFRRSIYEYTVDNDARVRTHFYALIFRRLTLFKKEIALTVFYFTNLFMSNRWVEQS